MGRTVIAPSRRRRPRRLLRGSFALVAGAMSVVVAPPTARAVLLPPLLSSTPIAASTRMPPAAVTCAPAPLDGVADAASSGGFHAVTPARIFDSRLLGGPIAAGCTVEIDVGALVPSFAVAVSLQIVAVDATGRGFVTAHPCSGPPPLVSNLNLRVGAAATNGVVVGLAPGRSVCVFVSTRTNLAVDLQGWFGPAGASFHGVAPVRAFDSRGGPRPDGGVGRIAAGTVTRIPITGANGIPAGAAAVSATLTVTQTGPAGYLTSYPCADSRPETSSLNHLDQDTRASHVLVGVDGTGALCVYTKSDLELIVDVTGWFGGTDGLRLHPLSPVRVADSREPGSWSGHLVAGETRQIDASRAGELPVGAGAFLDVVATNAGASGFVTVFPCGPEVPVTSTVNFLPGEDVANNVSIVVGGPGTVCVYASSPVDVVVDVFASYGSAGGLRSLEVTGHPLIPSFEPDGHDYGVICQAGENVVQVKATGVPGSAVAVGGGDAGGNVVVPVHGVVDVEVSLSGGGADRYHVRCLPPDFPAYTVARPETPGPGYYLFTFPSPPRSVIVDDHGAPLWYSTGSAFRLDFKATSTGELSWWTGAVSASGVGDGAVEHRAIDGSLIRAWSTVGGPTDLHDSVYEPDGDVLLITYHRREGVDISAFGPGYPATAPVLDAWVEEVRPDGTVGWSWHSEDHIAIAETTAHLDGVSVGLAGGVLDPVHLNSVEVEPVSGDLMMSFRHLDAVIRVRRAPGMPDDGKVLWKLGGNAPTDPATHHVTIVDDPHGGPHRQHDARFIGGGRIQLFDNAFNTGHPARAIVYALDEADWTATLEWQQDDPYGVDSFGTGSTRLQPDGSRVVCWGITTPFFSDYGPSGALALQVDAPGNFSYRVVKEPVSTFDRDVLRASSPG